MSDTAQQDTSNSQTKSRWRTAYSHIALSLVLGQCTGILGALYDFWNCSRFQFIGAYVWEPDRLWTPAFADMGLSIMILSCSWPLTLIFPRQSFNFIFSGILGFVLFSGLLFSIEKLSFLASVILSLGIAMKMATSFQNTPTSFLEVSRRIAPIGCSVILVAAGIIQGQRSLSEQHAVSELPDAPPDAPNIVFVVWDTVRADFVGTFNETGVRTPNLDQMANQGTKYLRAVAPASWTLPSRASMFTGQFPNDLSANWTTPIPDKQQMLAEELRKHGYLTAGFVSNTNFCGRSAGMDQGFTHFEDIVLNWKSISEANYYLKILYRYVVARTYPWKLEFRPGYEITNSYFKWREQTDSGNPVFTFMNYMDAHDPYLPRQFNDRSMTFQEVDQMIHFGTTSPDDIDETLRQLAMTCYRAQISALDQELGRIIVFLKEKQELNNTVIIVASDHGEQFGEHGIYNHGNSLYQTVVHVPLVICDFRNTENPSVIQEPVSLRNVGATIVDFAQIPQEQIIQGNSLRKLKIDAQIQNKQQRVVYGYNSMEELKVPSYPAPDCFKYSIGWEGRLDLWINDSHSLILGPGEHIEVYDLITDPLELNDISEETPEKSSKLKSELDAYLKK